MNLFLNTADLVDAVAGVLFLVLGVAVAIARPRTPASTALAGFALGAGAWSVLVNLDPGLSWADAAFAGSIVASLPLLLSLGWLAFRLGGPVGASAPAVVAAAFAAAVLPVIGFLDRDGAATASPAFANDLWFASIVVVNSALMGAIVLLTLRYPALAATRDRVQVATVVGALALQPGPPAGASLTSGDLSDAALSVGPFLILAALWLVYARRPEPGDRAARNVALALLGMPLAGALATARFGGVDGTFGVARVVAVALLSYAILRHQLLGLDVKVRFAISKSTVAAVFIAVFFVASEAAQQFFGETLGSSYVGILAAGTLVFAIAPLSRLA
ncbi:MAG: hypothetical protein ACT4PT_10420, partial [Methanobacteriota archaeon]